MGKKEKNPPKLLSWQKSYCKTFYQTFIPFLWVHFLWNYLHTHTAAASEFLRLIHLSISITTSILRAEKLLSIYFGAKRSFSFIKVLQKQKPLPTFLQLWLSTYNQRREEDEEGMEPQ